MKVKELIESLQKTNPEGQVFSAYDSDIVVVESGEPEQINSEAQIGDCWWRVKVGDVVILGKK